jgi:hypothetical protein
MLKRAIHLILIISFIGLSSAMAQDSTVIITIGGPTTSPCDENRIDIPIYMENPVEVGGFSIQILMTDPSWFSFDQDDPLAADTIGARNTGWASFDFNVHEYGYSITVTAIGPGGQNLQPGDGLIFTIHGNFNNKLVSDTCQLINFGSTTISDATGSNTLNRALIRDSLCVEACDTGLIRGDANYSGSLNGLDVTYLVTYFKGGPSICLGCPCLADANTSGGVNGLDVVFLVSYFKGGPAPDPPNCTE